MTDMSNVEFIRDLAARMFRSATPAMGFDQADTDRLYVIANRLATLEQAGEPVADGYYYRGQYLGKLATPPSDWDVIRGGTLINGRICWPEVAPLPTLQRLGQEFDAGEAVAWRYTRYDGYIIFRYNRDHKLLPPWTDEGVWTETPPYAHPPQSRGQAFDGEGEAATVRDFADKVMEAAHNCCIDPDAGPDCTTSVTFTGEEGAQIANALHRLAALSSAKRGEQG